MSAIKKLKVLEIIQPVDGGSAVHMRQLLSGLNLNDLEVHLAAPESSLYREVCDSRGIKYHVIKLRRSRNPLKDINPFLTLFKLCRHEKYDVVHAHCTKAGLIGRFAARLNGIRIVYTPHGFIYSQPSSKIFKFAYYWIERITLPLVNKVIFVSPSESEVAIADKVLPRQQARVIVNGVKTDFPQQKINHKPTIVMVSRFEEPKRPEELIKAIPLIIKKHPDVQFTLIGDGSKRSLVEQLISELDIENNVQLLGFRSDISNQLSIGVMAVLCSSSEGLPYVALEAMACSRPVVGTNVKGIIDVVHDGENGLLYELGDYKDLANKIISLLDNPKQAHEYGKRGREMVLKSYSAQGMINNIQRLYIENK